MGDSNSEWEEVAAEVSATTQMRQEVADELTHVLGHTSITTAFLTMAPDDMRVHCLNLPQAPAYFRLPPDPRRNYSWALGGFNLLQSTFFANGVSPDQICAYPLDKGVSRAGRTPGVVGLPTRGRRVDKEGAGTLLWPVPRLVLGL
eukprot:s5677_g4.t1